MTKPFAGGSALPSINVPTTIVGSGTTLASSAAPGTPTFRFFTVQHSLDLEGVTLQNGFSSGSGGFNGDGGAILNQGALSMVNDTLQQNGAARNGGAIYNTGLLTMDRTSVRGPYINAGNGAGIYNTANGHATITRSLIDFADAEAGLGGTAPGAGLGGGVYNLGSLAVTDSTLTNGTAVNAGGAIDSPGSAILTRDTISANSSKQGGGIASGGNVMVQGSIVATNRVGNCGGPVHDGGYNLEDSSTSSCGFSSRANDIIGADPKLGRLQYNGGPTWTQALLATSPAVNSIPAANGTLCGGTDQRGIQRPQGAGCDRGAFEQVADSVKLSSSPNPSVTGQAVALTVTVTPTVTMPYAPTGFATVLVSGPGGISTAKLRVSGGRAQSYSFTPTAPGTYLIVVSYQDDNGWYLSSNSAFLKQTVN
jgi:hypothetical protein